MGLILQMPETCIMPDHTIGPNMTKTQVSIYPEPLIKPPPRLPDIKTQHNRKINVDLHLEVNKDFEENSLYQEGIISEIYQRPDKSQLLEPSELADLVNTNNIVQNTCQNKPIDKIFNMHMDTSHSV